MKATGILWDVENEEQLESLPTEVDIPDGMTDEEDISDYLSDLTGFCHRGFSLPTDHPTGTDVSGIRGKESRSDRFCRVAEARVNKIIKMVRLLGNCSGTAYAFTPEQVQQIFATLREELNRAEKRYVQPSRKRFSLSDEQPESQPECPTIVQSLPDGSRLRAVASDDESYPGISIYWDSDREDVDGPICFVDYNSDRKAGHEVCIGAYQLNQDDPTYYRPYKAERNQI